MNNKGFTLVELLAVVVVLLLISTIAISSINSAVERNKIKQNATKKTVIESYAKLYYEEHRTTLSIGDCIFVGDLNLSESEREDADGNTFNGSVKVSGTINSPTFTYMDNCS